MIPTLMNIDFLMNRHRIVCWSGWQIPVVSAKNKGFDDKYYKDLIVEYLKQYDKARKKEIRELLWDKLPDALSEKQKENKIRNLLYSLKQKQIIETDSTNQQKSNWILKK